MEDRTRIIRHGIMVTYENGKQEMVYEEDPDFIKKVSKGLEAFKKRLNKTLRDSK